MQWVSPATKSFLSAMAIGILIFLLWDVLTAAVEPVEEALRAGNDRRFLSLAVLLAAGFAVGLMSLALYDGWLRRRRAKAMLGPGAASIAEYQAERHIVTMSPSLWLASSSPPGSDCTTFRRAWPSASPPPAASSASPLPLSSASASTTRLRDSASSRRSPRTAPVLGVPRPLGLIGGGPTFVGTLIGQSWVNDTLSIAFLALAAGSILYVVIELILICGRAVRKEILLAGILLEELVLGFGTDFVLVAVGA